MQWCSESCRSEANWGKRSLNDFMDVRWCWPGGNASLPQAFQMALCRVTLSVVLGLPFGLLHRDFSHKEGDTAMSRKGYTLRK